MAALFKDHPEWLFTPDDNHDLAYAIEHRPADGTTDYRLAASWKDAPEILENTFSSVLAQNR